MCTINLKFSKSVSKNRERATVPNADDRSSKMKSEEKKTAEI